MGIEVKITAADATELGDSIKGLYQRMFGAPAEAPPLVRFTPATGEVSVVEAVDTSSTTVRPSADTPKRPRGRPPKIAEPAVPPVAKQLQQSLAEEGSFPPAPSIEPELPADPAPAEPDPTPTITFQEAKDAAIAFIGLRIKADGKAHDHVAKGNVFRALLDHFKVAQMSALPPDQYPAWMAHIAEETAKAEADIAAKGGA